MVKPLFAPGPPPGWSGITIWKKSLGQMLLEKKLPRRFNVKVGKPAITSVAGRSGLRTFAQHHRWAWWGRYAERGAEDRGTVKVTSER